MSDTIYKQPGKPPFMAFLGQRYMETVKNKQTNPFIFRVISQSCFTNLREDTKPLVNYTAFYFLFWLPLCYKSRGVTSVVISLSERKNVCFDQKHTLHLFTGFVKTMHNSKPATEKDQTHFSLSWEYPAVSFKQQDAQVFSLSVQSRVVYYLISNTVVINLKTTKTATKAN